MIGVTKILIVANAGQTGRHVDRWGVENFKAAHLFLTRRSPIVTALDDRGNRNVSGHHLVSIFVNTKLPKTGLIRRPRFWIRTVANDPKSWGEKNRKKTQKNRNHDSFFNLKIAFDGKNGEFS